MEASPTLSHIGLAGLAVMGKNLALNIVEKGFPISVYNPAILCSPSNGPDPLLSLSKLEGKEDEEEGGCKEH
ncbi:hypothetical protein ACFX13_039578 [Malus domestica]